MTLVYLQSRAVVIPDLYWKRETLRVDDIVVIIVTLSIITLVSWLSNREIEKSLLRARNSEAALKKERDGLEEKVEERTRELKQVQMEKMINLYKFADVGKMAAGLFHDLTNPLTVVSLNLGKLNRHGSGVDVRGTREAIDRAMSSTQRMERFVEAARKQIQQQREHVVFSLLEEIEQAVQILDHKAKEYAVQVHVVIPRDVKLYGDPVKFNQVVTNVVANAIDSYRDLSAPDRKREILVQLHQRDRHAVLTIQDWGCGIAEDVRAKIFEPLFTTKEGDDGTGIGLSIAKDSVEKDFHGTIAVESREGKGTTFTITLSADTAS